MNDMAVKNLRKNLDGKKWAEFRKGCRKYHVKFWKKTCPWYCRPRQCVKALIMITKNKDLLQRGLMEIHYNKGYYNDKKKWQ